jgi:hypothetical protein
LPTTLHEGDLKRPLGIAALIAFFWFGMAMSGISFLSLLFPGSFLEPMWRLNPRAREGFAEIGLWAVPLMLWVSIACASAAIGLARRRLWGHRLAIAIITINMLGDLGNAVLLHDLRTLIGVPIALVIIWYLLRRDVRPYFAV